MKFKRKDELKNEQKKIHVNPDCAFQFGIDIAFESFAERIKFYKKYKSNNPNITSDTRGVNKFRKDFPEIYANADFRKLSWWNDWLLDHCFGDIKK